MWVLAEYVPCGCIEKAIAFGQKPPEKCNLVAKSEAKKRESCSVNAQKTMESIQAGREHNFLFSDHSAL